MCTSLSLFYVMDGGCFGLVFVDSLCILQIYYCGTIASIQSMVHCFRLSKYRSFTLFRLLSSYTGPKPFQLHCLIPTCHLLCAASGVLETTGPHGMHCAKATMAFVLDIITHYSQIERVKGLALHSSKDTVTQRGKIFYLQRHAIISITCIEHRKTRLVKATKYWQIHFRPISRLRVYQYRLKKFHSCFNQYIGHICHLEYICLS